MRVPTCRAAPTSLLLAAVCTAAACTALRAPSQVYAHAYDQRVGQCLEPGSRVYEFGNAKGLGGFFAWRRDRVRTEILLHLLHALGIIEWVQ